MPDHTITQNDITARLARLKPYLSAMQDQSIIDETISLIEELRRRADPELATQDAFNRGYAQAQHDMRLALGISD